MSESKRIVSREEWTVARKAFLDREKAFDRERDALAAARRELPRVRIETPYVFEEPSGKRTLADLFDGKPQLIVYHFMLAPKAAEGCRGCSFIADNIEGGYRHFAGRETAFAMVSRADVPTIEAYKKRMGWTSRWLSSAGSDFNSDFGVTFKSDEDGLRYNFGTGRRGAGDRPGLSCFARDRDQGNDVFHTYSTYERGLDMLLSTYNYLDLTPLGRHEEGLPFPMAWVKRHDEYGDHA